MRRALLALVLLVPLGGCQNLSTAFQVATGSVATVAPVTISDAEKGLTVAHLALNAVAENILTATHNGTLHGTLAGEVKTLFDKADDALKAADQADSLANAPGITAKVKEATDLIATIQNLVKG
jgi:hypothetical protein